MKKWGKADIFLDFQKKQVIYFHTPLQRGPTFQKGNVKGERGTFVSIDIVNISLILENVSEHPDVALPCHYIML